MNNELPQGWTTTSFMDVFDIQGGTQPPKKTFKYEPTHGYVRLLQIRDFGAKPQPTFVRLKATLKTCRQEDILIGRYGASVGRICTGMEGAYNVALAKVIIPEGLSKHYVFWLLQSPIFQRPLLEIQRSAQDGFNKEDLAEILLPLAPIAEQRRIAVKLEQLLKQVAACHQRLAKIPALLKRFRQSVLSAACSGRLTANWRGSNDSADNDFPIGWECKTLNSIFTVRTGGTPSRQTPSYFEKGTIPWVKTSEVQNCDIIQTEEFITKRAAGESNAKVFPTGTLLVAMYGEGKTRGQIGRLTFPAATNQACAALINTNLPQTTNNYVFYYLLSQYYALRAQSVGGNQPNLNLGIIKDWLIPVPPLPEQQQIVRQVENLFALADRIEARFAEARKRVDSISQSILAKAFRGELVPTEAELAKAEGRSFESAVELLEGIQKNGQSKEAKIVAFRRKL